MQIQCYLFFNGNCDEAVAFYGRALGASVEHLSRFRDSPEPLPEGMVPAGWDGKVMHVSLKVGDSVVMACDSPEGGVFKGTQLSVNTRDMAQARQVFDALADGGQVTMPLGKTFWSAGFGMVSDRFGVPWMVNVDH
jgi:PhnB protein